MAQRAIHVPVPTLEGRSESSGRVDRPLPVPQPSAPVDVFFRSISWTGEPIQAVEPPRLGELATLTVRASLGRTAWSGEPESPPTEVQKTTSVRSILSGFGWE